MERKPYIEFYANQNLKGNKGSRSIGEILVFIER